MSLREWWPSVDGTIERLTGDSPATQQRKHAAFGRFGNEIDDADRMRRELGRPLSDDEMTALREKHHAAT